MSNIKPLQLLFVVTLFSLSGCATIINGKRATVHVKTNYNDAKVTYVDRNGKSSLVGTGNVVSVTFSKKDLDKGLIQVSRNSCQTNVVTVNGEFDPISLLNILGSVALGFIVDAATGAIKQPSQTEIQLSPICK